MAVLALGACGSKPPDAAAPSEPVATDSTGTPIPPAPTSVACDQALAIECGAGASDGCADGSTTAHLCVMADAVATAGPPCAQEIALNCAQGQFDACLRSPALSASHICAFDPPPP